MREYVLVYRTVMQGFTSVICETRREALDFATRRWGTPTNADHRKLAGLFLEGHYRAIEVKLGDCLITFKMVPRGEP